ncbi:MAG: ABC transporter ATP-binding protein [Eubacteriales bacterium]|nr:ABC transporter ATP-binding protein [Eubacteriales bacterium]
MKKRLQKPSQSQGTSDAFEFTPEEKRMIDTFTRNEHHLLRILFQILKGHYWKLIISALCFVAKHSPVWALPIVIARIVDIATQPQAHSTGEIYVCGAIMALLVIQNILTNYWHTRLYSQTIRSLEANLRGSLIRKLQQLSILFQKEIQSGRLQSKIMRDVENIETMVQQAFTNLVSVLTTVTVALIITVTKSPVVFAFFIASVPIACATVIFFRKGIRKRNTEFRREMENTSARVLEMVEMIPVTRAHALEKNEIGAMDAQIGEVADKGYKLDIVQSFFGSVSWAVFQLFQIACLCYTGTLAFMGTITVGDITMYQSYFTTVINSVSSVVNLLPVLSKGMESIDSVGDILTAMDVENDSDKKAPKDIQGAFTFENVCYSYPDDGRAVLTDFSLNVKAGETIAFVGESGSGKTTLLNLVIGFLHPTSGRILLDGEDMSELSMREYRKHLAVVPQESIMFDDTLRKNITYGLDSVTDEQLKDVISRCCLSEVIERLPSGIDTSVGEHGGRLSGGQRQRVSIARALIRKAKIIIMDEATSALDSVSEKRIQEAVSNLTKNATTFIVAHRLSTIKNADRIVVIQDGSVVEQGSYDELVQKRGAFFKMREMQQ